MTYLPNHQKHASSRLRRAITTLAVVALTMLCVAGRAAGTEPVRIAILCPAHKSYREAVTVIEAELEKSGHQCIHVELPSDGENSQLEAALAQLSQIRPAVIVTAGAEATTVALEATEQVPVIFCLVPNALDQSFMAGNSRHRARLAGATTDIAPREQVKWLRETRPRTRNIAILYSDRTKRTMQAIRSAAESQGITVCAIEAHKSDFPKAIETLNSTHCDGVVMLPDAAIYNSATVQRLLLWGIRAKKPVWTFSANIVKAGAFTGLYCDRVSTGHRTAELVKKVIAGTDAATIGLEYCDCFKVALNERTAEIIGVSLSRRTAGAVTIRYGANN